MGNLAWMARLVECEVADASYHPEANPLVFARAKGSYVFDSEGKRFIDLCAGFGALAFGHSPTYQRDFFAQFVRSQESYPLIQGMGDVYPNEAKIKLAEQILTCVPSHLKKVAFSVTGSQAIETALKTVMLKTREDVFIAFSGAYHGVDFGSLRVTANPFFKEGFNSWCDDSDSPTGRPRVVRLPFNCSKEIIEEALAMLKTKWQCGIAGIIVEPVQGRNGVHFAETSWLGMLKDLAHSQRAYLIFDEIFCGMGRLGKITFSEDVAADVVCFGKALGGGFPISATLGTDEVMSAWPLNKGEARNTGTYYGHPFAAQIALETVKQISSPDTLQMILDKGNFFKEEITKNINFNNGDSEITVRGAGLMWALDFGQPGLGAKCMDSLRRDGVIALASGAQGESISFSPAYSIDREDISIALRLLKNHRAV